MPEHAAADYRERRVLGRTGLLVSRLGLAAGYGIGAEGVETAFQEHGVNYFYWGSRRTSGMAQVLRRLAKSDRHRVVIALQSYDHLGWFMGKTVERGLRALGTDFCDVLILGWFNRFPGSGVLEAALRLKESGKVRFLAMSGHNRPLFGSIAAGQDSPVDVFMVRYSAAHRGAEKEIFPFLPAEGRPGVTAYTATRWGRLLAARRMPPGERPLTASECYRFVLADPRVDLCMTGPRNVREMREGLAALRDGPLTERELERIRRIGDHVHG